MAVKAGGGTDPEKNRQLGQVIAEAKQANMPADNIARAIKKGTGELEGVHYEEITYEGYGPGGAAILVDVVTDNKNRTVGELRTIFSKNGGHMGESGCVSWMFEKKGLAVVNATEKSEDELLELAMDAGADDMQTVSDHFEITSSLENFESVRKSLEDHKIKTVSASLTKIPKTTVLVEEKHAKTLLKLMDLLEDHDDIQKTYSNFDISEEVMAALIQNS